jgi:hypothetical protein
MSTDRLTSFDKALARICELCPMCRQARRDSQGIACRIVKSIESALCPFCRAYERVHGVKAHEKTEILSER